MKRLNLNIRLLIAFGILLAGTVVSESFFRKPRQLEYVSSMNESVILTKKWFSVIEQLKKEKGIISDAMSNIPYKYMMGNEWSEITTTMGSLDAKETSANPDFSALIIRLLHESKIKKGDKVGVVLSGSFPSLAISVLAALQTMEVEAVVMSSIGASTYGANQPEATWVDMESVLIESAGLRYRSKLVTIGAGEDSGTGLSDEGLIKIRMAAERNKINLYIPASLKESIDKRVNIFNEEKISILINIGGNQTALGNCPHSTLIPNGLHTGINKCSDENRGLIARMNELGVPYINLLDIKDLASQYGMAVSPGVCYTESTNLFEKTTTNKPVLGIILSMSLLPLYFLRKNSSIQ
jgi:poly-gamma-glutamate system protein